MEDVVRRAHQAMLARDWEDLRVLLHPYLHWTATDGRTVRGRTKVMAMLAERDPPLWPVTVEVRDDQVYRWQEPPN
jgi:Domain of unknown function (DUF4440)